MTAIDAPHCPNHHAHHRGFSGLSGILAALSMALGRERRRPPRRRPHRARARRPPARPRLRPRRRGALRRPPRRPVTGVDPAPVMLDVARRLTREATSPTCEGAAEAIPLPDAAATVVWALATVHHWPAARAGAPGGGARARPWRSVPRRRAAHDPGRDRAGQPRLDRRPGRRRSPRLCRDGRLRGRHASQPTPGGGRS